MDLSEDLNELSTHNDEICVLLFFYNGDSLIAAPITQASVLEQGDTFSFAINPSLFRRMDTAYIFILEQDDDRDPDLIAQSFAQDTKNIYYHYFTSNNDYFSNLLLDDELLFGLAYDQSHFLAHHTFEGTHLFDNYRYLITKDCLP